MRRMALDAANLRLKHPTSGKVMLFKTECPADIQQDLGELHSLSTEAHSAD